MIIVDASTQTAAALPCLKRNGVEAVGRYYARETKHPKKRLTRAEAEAIVGAGMRITVFHQSAGDSAGDFSLDIGERDGSYARRYASLTVGQPENSAIYFAV